MEDLETIESQRKNYQQNIMLDNSRMTSPTSDEEMRHARMNASNESSSSDQ